MNCCKKIAAKKYEKISKKYLHYVKTCSILSFVRGQAVKTLASHAGIRGSIPLGVTKKALETGLFSYLVIKR